MKEEVNNKYLEAYNLYLQGMSLREVGEKIGVTRQCVFDAFKARKLTMRTPNKREIQVFDEKKFTLRDSGYFSLTVGKRTLMHRYVWSFFNGEIPEGFDVHHRNFNRKDNRIENLECLSKPDHTKRYSPHNNQFTKGRRIEGKCKAI